MQIIYNNYCVLNCSFQLNCKFLFFFFFRMVQDNLLQIHSFAVCICVSYVSAPLKWQSLIQFILNMCENLSTEFSEHANGSGWL